MLLACCLYLQSYGQTAPNEDIKAIEQVIEQFKQAIETENKDDFMKLFVKEKISWVGNGSRGSIFDSPEGFMNLLASTGDCREDFHNVEIWNDHLVGTVTFDYGFFMNDQVQNWGKESWMLIKQSDGWKITSVNFSMILAFEKPYPFADKK